jgi:hypothetical protein
VIDDLDRLSASLDTLSPTDSDHEAVTARLRALLARWTVRRDDVPDPVADRIDTASADEILAFIDNQLGRPDADPRTSHPERWEPDGQ